MHCRTRHAGERLAKVVSGQDHVDLETVPHAVLSFVLGLSWGIRGVAGSYVITTLVLAYPLFATAFRLIGLRCATLGMRCGGRGQCGARVAAANASLAALTLLVPLGAVIYLACSWATNCSLLLEVLSMVRGTD